MVLVLKCKSGEASPHKSSLLYHNSRSKAIAFDKKSFKNIKESKYDTAKHVF